MFDIRLFLLYPTFVPTCSDTDADLLCLLLSHSYCAFCLILTICLLRRQPPYFLIPVLDPLYRIETPHNFPLTLIIHCRLPRPAFLFYPALCVSAHCVLFLVQGLLDEYYKCIYDSLCD